MDTLATHLTQSQPESGTIDFTANFVSAASIASEIVLGEKSWSWKYNILYLHNDGETVIDLSASLFDVEGSRTSRAIDIATDKYDLIGSFECFNTTVLARDKRVIDANHPLVSELVKRRDDFMRVMKKMSKVSGKKKVIKQY
jgi:hypothetical protein